MLRNRIHRALASLGASFGQGLLGQMRSQQKELNKQLEHLGERLDAMARRAEKAEMKIAEDRERLDKMLRGLSYQQVELRLAMKRLGRPGSAPRRSRTLAPEPPRLRVADLITPDSPVPNDSILELSACPVCGCPAFTRVCEYNKFLTIDSPLIDRAASFYDYSLCHDCGVVFAACRPVGERYKHLIGRFEVAIGRSDDAPLAGGAKAAISSASLSDEDKRVLRERVARGVFVSEHLGVPKREYVRDLLRDRLANSAHIEVLGSLLSLDKPRVLELRPRSGSIGAALKRLYGADVYAMPLFEGQQFLIREAYGIPADHTVDYDRFSIPYEGQFDLIVGNHMLTHVLRPQEFFRTLRAHLKPGGHIYLYNEPDESEFLEDEKDIINRLNAFHVQVFNASSLTRALSASGFEPVFVTRHDDHILALAGMAFGEVRWEKMAPRERERRVTAYQAARDLAVLKLPDHARDRAGTRDEEVLQRVFAR